MKNFLLKTCLTMLCLVLGIGSAWAEEVTWTASEQNYSNAESIESFTITEGITASLNKNGGTQPAYYNTGTALRLYAKNKMTISAASGYNITKIVLNLGSSNTGTISTDPTGYSLATSTGTWSGNAASITFSNTASSGHARVESITVTYTKPSKKNYAVFKNKSITIHPNDEGNISEFVNSTPSDYDGTVYFSCSDIEGNTFMFDDSDNSYLAVAEGSVTLYASANATAKYNLINEELTINVEKAKKAANISFATPSYTFTVFDENKTTQNVSNPNSLSLTYTSSNENVANVDESGNVTINDYAGTATITATFDGDDDYYAASASFDITVNRAQTGYAFSASSVDVTIGESFDVPTISAANPNADLTLTFSSSNSSVATVTPVTSAGRNSYALTIKGTGSTTIKASWQQTTRFERGEATYTLRVLDPNGNGESSEVTYVKITGDLELEDGLSLLIVNEGAEKAMSTNQGSNTRGATSVTITSNSITNLPNDAQVITLEGTTGAWYFNVGSSYLRAAGTSSNLLKTSTSKDNYCKATITISNGNAAIIFQGGNDRNTLRYNSSNSIFAAYSSGMDNVQLYKKVGGAAPRTYGQFTISDYFTDGEGNYYGTFYSENAWEVPAGVEAQAVGVTDDKLTISTLNDNDNNVVAAGTAVLLKASAPGTYVYAESEEDGVSNANNLLDGSSVAVTAESMATAHPNCIYYRMTKHNGTTLGFWWGAEDGAAFALAANKAYLAVPTQQASNLLGFRFGDYTITAIQEAELQNKGAAIYNLQGQRINRLQQGVNIVNGRKVIR